MREHGLRDFGEALAPDGFQWSRVVLVGGMQSRVISRLLFRIAHFEPHLGQSGTAKNLAQPQAGDPSVEILKRMNEKEAAFRESQRFDQEFFVIAGKVFPPSAKVADVIT